MAGPNLACHVHKQRYSRGASRRLGGLRGSLTWRLGDVAQPDAKTVAASIELHDERQVRVSALFGKRRRVAFQGGDPRRR